MTTAPVAIGMTKSQEIKKKLEKLGLSEKQASIYLLLTGHHELRIQEIANLTKIPRSSVYESLKGLSQLGLVEELVEEKFKKIKPYPIGSIRHVLNERILELQKRSISLADLEKSLELPPQDQQLISTKVRYYKEISGARQLFWNSLRAKSIVYVYSAYGRSKFVGKKFYMDFVRESLERKIIEKVLVNPTNRFFELLKRDLGSPLARTEVKDLRTLNKNNIIIVGETFIYDNIYAQVYLDGSQINGFEIESREFVETQRSIFETLWNLAKPISL